MLNMDLFYLIIGILALTVGVMGLAFEAYRWMRGSGLYLRMIQNGLWSSASLTVGLYLILDSRLWLAAFILFVLAGGAHTVHLRRERSRQGLKA
jgi:hypothetical protein